MKAAAKNQQDEMNALIALGVDVSNIKYGSTAMDVATLEGSDEVITPARCCPVSSSLTIFIITRLP